MFIGRKKELAILEAHTQSDRFEFGLIYGRRRVGKTRLLQKIAQVDHAIYFVANDLLFKKLDILNLNLCVLFSKFHDFLF